MGPHVQASALGDEILLVFFPDQFRPNLNWIAKTEAAYPGLKVRWVPQTDPATGKIRDINELPDDTWEGVTLLATLWPPAASKIPNVRFVQLPSAGADRWIAHETYKNPNIVICTGNGMHAPQIAEWVIGTWLMARHHFLAWASYMPTGTGWAHNFDHPGEDSSGTRIGILGYGAIGRQVAHLAQPFGMEVYAYTRSEKATAEARRDDSFVLPGAGDPEGMLPAKWFHGGDSESINHFLAQDLDFLVVATPLTAATTGLLGSAQFELLGKARRAAGKPGTYVANIARGKVINTDALMAALEAGDISGAALDVTDPEPLPADHKLWHAPNVFITPHVSWQSTHMLDRVMAMLGTNLGRLFRGEPLINVLNKEFHY